MSRRTITGHITKNSLTDLKGGGYAVFTVDYDSGTVPTGTVASATMNLTDIRCYSTAAYLQVRFDSSNGDVLAETNALSGDQTIHSEDFVLTAAANELLTATPATIYVGVVTTSGTTNKINFREECCISLEIEYKLPPTPCTEPSDVKLSAGESSDEYVLLTWTAGSGGVNNEFDRYLIYRQTGRIANGGFIWDGALSEYGESTVTSCHVAVPDSYSQCFRFFVQTCGMAGYEYDSAMVISGPLTRKRPDITPFTDPALTSGETKVKAVHMLELQSNINRLLEGLGNTGATFSTIRAGYTSLGDWKTHVLELREAVDNAGWAHEAWIPIPVNRPTAAVIEQLRQVVEDMLP